MCPGRQADTVLDQDFVSVSNSVSVSVSVFVLVCILFLFSSCLRSVSASCFCFCLPLSFCRHRAWRVPLQIPDTHIPNTWVLHVRLPDIRTRYHRGQADALRTRAPGSRAADFWRVLACAQRIRRDRCAAPPAFARPPSLRARRRYSGGRPRADGPRARYVMPRRVAHLCVRGDDAHKAAVGYRAIEAPRARQRPQSKCPLRPADRARLGDAVIALDATGDSGAVHAL